MPRYTMNPQDAPPPEDGDDDDDLLNDALEDAVEEEVSLPGGTAERPLSVSALNSMLQNLLAAALPPVVYIQGEISNFRTYDRGHAFFTLKEPGAEMPCVIWKDSLARLKFRPKDGLAVVARGNIKLYEPQGKIQLYVESLMPQGAGALELAFRQLCEKLRAEGLFETARKRPIPRLPQRVVIITSKTGDVLHDVLTTAYRRFPGLHAMLFPVRVQGEQAAPEIAKAIRAINTWNDLLLKHAAAPPAALGPASPAPIDLILLVRGGGSLEDLWAFNEEVVARAIVASRIPIATGIGHEPDTTIADLVGDLRGPTPTGVTELTIPDTRALSAEITAMQNLLTRDMRRTLELAIADARNLHTSLTHITRESLRQRRTELEGLTRAVERIEPRHAIAQGWRRVEESDRNLRSVSAAALRREADRLTLALQKLERTSPVQHLPRLRDRLDHLEATLKSTLQNRLAASSQKLSAITAQLRVVSPQAVLDRGYSITTTREGTIVRTTSEVTTGDILHTRVADGTITSTVGKPKQQSLF